MIHSIYRIIKSIILTPCKIYKQSKLKNLRSFDYWTKENVTNHRRFQTVEESKSYFRWRSSIYLGYLDLMPVTGHSDKVILDYGCGPGHDLIGFVEYSNPSKVYGVDVSVTSLQESADRVKLHGKNDQVELIHIKEGAKIPLPDNSVDYIHSSGVLHHTPNMDVILAEFKRVLKDDGLCRIMIYNQESIWYHLYVPYVNQIRQKKYRGLSSDEAFRKSTDGEHCPISKCFTPDDFVNIVQKQGFEGSFLGAAISCTEMNWLQENLYDAIQDVRLAEKHREFLTSITFNEKKIPCYNGEVAGIDGVFEFRKKLGTSK